MINEITRVTRSLGESMQSRGVSLDFDLPKEAVEIQTDASKFRQLITILIGNAMTHSVSGGTVKVSVDEGELVVEDSRFDSQHKASPLPGVVERELLARRGLVTGELGYAVAEALAANLGLNLDLQEDRSHGLKSTLSLAQNS